MTDSLPAEPDAVDAGYPVELTSAEMSLVRAALRLLLSTLGKEEADELHAVKALLERLPKAPGASGG